VAIFFGIGFDAMAGNALWPSRAGSRHALSGAGMVLRW
jgi:hypothetical protein